MQQQGCGAEFGGAEILVTCRRLWPLWALLIAVWLMLAAPAWAADPLDPLAPTASISASPNPAVTDQTVTFDGTGSFDVDGTVDRYEWDLDGDGSFETDTGSTASATSSYADPETVTVRLRVTDSDLKTGEAETSLTIKDPPTAGFNFSPSSPSTDETISFHSTSSDVDGTIDSYAWDFNNDGITDATDSDPTHSYGDAGTFQVTLTVVDNDGLSGVVTKNVPVTNKNPIASFGYSPTSPATDETVTFTSTSSDPDGSIESTLWDFDNDGEYDDGSGTVATWQFSKSGPNTVKLKVVDEDSGEDTVSQSVTVSNRPPTLVDFTASPPSPLTNEDVTFTALVEDPDSASFTYAWDLDDNGSFETTGSGTPSRQYTTPGPRDVTLRVTDDGGNSRTATHQIVVANRPPDNVDFTFTPALFQTLEEVTFTSTATDSDGTLTYEWDFNADNIYEQSGKSVKYTFGTPGPHVVRHRVTDDSGAVKTVEQTVTPGNRSPTAAFGFSPTAPRTLETVTFTSSSSDPDGPLASQLWDLNGNGVFQEPGDASGPTAGRQFPVAGTYTVGLKVTDGTGSSNVITRTVTVANRPPVASFNSPSSPRTLDDLTFTSTSTDPEGLPLTIAWDLDNNGSYEASGPTSSRRFTTSGNYPVRIRVTDASGDSVTASRTIAVANRPPTATFTQSPTFPRAFETVTFTSTAGDLDGTVVSQAWDLDNDGTFDDGTTVKVTKKFTESRSFTVRLRAVDNKGAEAIVAQTVVIGNRPPIASFSFLPAQPLSGQTVNFFSTSSDPDSPIASQLWDLDGNGSYSDASGPSVARAYGVGSHVVSLLVTDSEGDSSFVSQTLNVTAPPAQVAATATGGSRFLSPFPIVRISGTIRGRGTRLRRLTVTAPPGSTVTVNCRGKGCPFGRQSRVVKSGADGSRRATQVMRLSRFERRTLRPGTIIKLFITKASTIGKYTRFKIRSRKPPARVDRCLVGGTRKPVNCPTS
jgi:PKD repeat protein